jgi:hypothetical protein
LEREGSFCDSLIYSGWGWRGGLTAFLFGLRLVCLALGLIGWVGEVYTSFVTCLCVFCCQSLGLSLKLVISYGGMNMYPGVTLPSS